MNNHLFIVIFVIVTAFTGLAKANSYLQGFQALEQRDYKTALYFLSFFAASGDARAQYNLAIMYRDGLGVEQNDVQALSFFIQAAEGEHMLAKYAVGLAFRHGRGSDVDANAAIEYLSEAALQGHALSPLKIGTMYFHGKVISKNLVASHFWWSLARDRNAPGAAENLALLDRQMNEAQKRQVASLQQNCKTMTLRQCINTYY